MSQVKLLYVYVCMHMYIQDYFRKVSAAEAAKKRIRELETEMDNLRQRLVNSEKVPQSYPHGAVRGGGECLYFPLLQAKRGLLIMIAILIRGISKEEQKIKDIKKETAAKARALRQSSEYSGLVRRFDYRCDQVLRARREMCTEQFVIHFGADMGFLLDTQML